MSWFFGRPRVYVLWNNLVSTFYFVKHYSLRPCVSFLSCKIMGFSCFWWGLALTEETFGLVLYLRSVQISSCGKSPLSGATVNKPQYVKLGRLDETWVITLIMVYHYENATVAEYENNLVKNPSQSSSVRAY